MEPTMAQRIIMRTKEALEEVMAKGNQPVVLASHQARRFVRRLLERTLPNIAVIAHSEISGNVKVQTLKVVRL